MLQINFPPPQVSVDLPIQVIEHANRGPIQQGEPREVACDFLQNTCVNPRSLQKCRKGKAQPPAALLRNTDCGIAPIKSESDERDSLSAFQFMSRKPAAPQSTLPSPPGRFDSLLLQAENKKVVDI